jgi:4-hydroxybenzoate polyprenyltransferase
MTIAQRIATWGSLVKFSHSVFALPFAMMMVVLIARSHSVSAIQLSALLVCIVSARTAAMGFNRLVDVQIDSKNPRTQGREIPSGKVSQFEGIVLTSVAMLVFFAGAAVLGRHCLVLAPVVLGVLFGYSYVKRWSALCHLILGIALALAPGGVWYALTAEWSWLPVPLMGAVALWVAGFDIVYSCQDEAFDREQGLFSVPSLLGARRAIIVAALCHLASVLLLVVSGGLFDGGLVFYLGVAVFSLLLVSQYVAISRRGLECVDQVFFSRNGAASVLLFVFVLLDALVIR